VAVNDSQVILKRRPPEEVRARLLAAASDHPELADLLGVLADEIAPEGQ
jgi:hypothetical protein